MRAANAELESSLERARAEISQMMDQLRVRCSLCMALFIVFLALHRTSNQKYPALPTSHLLQDPSTRGFWLPSHKPISVDKAWRHVNSMYRTLSPEKHRQTLCAQDDARALKAAERQRQEAEFQAVSLRQALDAAKRSVATREQDFVRLQQNLHTARAELTDLQSRYR